MTRAVIAFAIVVSVALVAFAVAVLLDDHRASIEYRAAILALERHAVATDRVLMSKGYILEAVR